MKHLVTWTTLAVLLSCPAVALCQQPTPPPKPENLQEKASYAIGLSIGKNLKADKIEVSLKYLVQGLMDAVQGTPQLVPDEEAFAALREFSQQAEAQQAAEMKQVASSNLAKGQKFLAENKAKQGVVTLPSGLQYKVLKAGNGASPKATDVVKTHYHGTLIDGTVFDSSVQREEPAQFPVNRVIPGWTEALQKMRVGDKWVLYVPPNLAYGENGAGNVIGPNETLIFEVELLDILKQQ